MGYVLVREAETLLQVHRVSIYRALQTGRVLGINDSGAWYVSWHAAKLYWAADEKVLDPPNVGSEVAPLLPGAVLRGLRPDTGVVAARLRETQLLQDRAKLIVQATSKARA